MDHMIVKNVGMFRVVQDEHIEEARGRSTHKRLLDMAGILKSSGVDQMQADAELEK